MNFAVLLRSNHVKKKLSRYCRTVLLIMLFCLRFHFKAKAQWVLLRGEGNIFNDWQFAKGKSNFFLIEVFGNLGEVLEKGTFEKFLRGNVWSSRWLWRTWKWLQTRKKCFCFVFYAQSKSFWLKTINQNLKYAKLVKLFNLQIIFFVNVTLSTVLLSLIKKQNQFKFAFVFITFIHIETEQIWYFLDIQNRF